MAIMIKVSLNLFVDSFVFLLDICLLHPRSVWLTPLRVFALGQLPSLPPCWSVDFKSTLEHQPLGGRLNFIDWPEQVEDLLCRKHTNSSPACPWLMAPSTIPNGPTWGQQGRKEGADSVPGMLVMASSWGFLTSCSPGRDVEMSCTQEMSGSAQNTPHGQKYPREEGQVITWGQERVELARGQWELTRKRGVDRAQVEGEGELSGVEGALRTLQCVGEERGLRIT